jgi:hypothetical protein
MQANNNKEMPNGFQVDPKRRTVPQIGSVSEHQWSPSEPMPNFKKVSYLYNEQKNAFICNAAQLYKPPLDALSGYMVREVGTKFQMNPQPPYTIRNTAYAKGRGGFITALDRTSHVDWYVGCHYRMIEGKRVINTVIVHFLPYPARLDLYYLTDVDNLRRKERIDYGEETIILIILSKH